MMIEFTYTGSHYEPARTFFRTLISLNVLTEAEYRSTVECGCVHCREENRKITIQINKDRPAGFLPIEYNIYIFCNLLHADITVIKESPGTIDEDTKDKVLAAYMAYKMEEE